MKSKLLTGIALAFAIVAMAQNVPLEISTKSHNLTRSDNGRVAMVTTADGDGTVVLPEKPAALWYVDVDCLVSAGSFCVLQPFSGLIAGQSSVSLASGQRARAIYSNGAYTISGAAGSSGPEFTPVAYLAPGTNGGGLLLAIPGPLQLSAPGGVPTTVEQAICSAAVAGTIWYSGHVADVKDSVVVCAANDSNVYAWRAIY